VGGLRGGERAAATQQEVREEVREEASSGLGRLTLIRKSGATLSGTAQATAAPPSVALHLPRRAPLSLRGSHCRATGSSAVPSSAAPPWMARLKRVILVKLFRRWFIFYDCIKFRLILSKSPDSGNKGCCDRKRCSVVRTTAVKRGDTHSCTPTSIFFSFKRRQKLCPHSINCNVRFDGSIDAPEKLEMYDGFFLFHLLTK
jgi:hypothetical protein